jgi:hypothetical protein
LTLHFIHIPKTGGTAIKDALTSAGLAYSADEDPFAVPETPYGRIALHVHDFRLQHVPPTDYVFFCIRDPISRFLSGFHSRLRKGSPRFDIEWTKEERKVFDAFPTPQRLVAALAGDDAEERLLGEWAMRQVVHFSPMEEFVGEPRHLSARLDQVVYIARQETLGADWKQLRALLGLPHDLRLPLDPVRSHRAPSGFDSTLDDLAVRTLRDRYRRDYRLVLYCDRLRASRGWGVGPPPIERVPGLR